jgi:hypothetical protein
MSNRHTPETDAVAEKNIYGVACKVDVDVARKLERERDEAMERCAKLQDIAERAVNLGLGSHSFSLSETFKRIAHTLNRSTQPCKK